jgi:DNA-binding transcriptional MocR family regulator
VAVRNDFQRLADEVAARITDGTLRPGDRLPTQRAYAVRRGIAPSTAARVYRELVHRGLITGEVGRGSYVRAAPGGAQRGGPALAEPAGARIDLELNYPVTPGQAELLARPLAALLRPDALGDTLRPLGAAGTELARVRFAQLAAHRDWTPSPDAVLFAGNARQATAAALAALVPAGGRVGVEALTYPAVKSAARRLGVTVVALPMDAHGPDPVALAAIHRATPLRAVYLQPRLHNPLGLSWPAARRDRLAEVLAATAIPVIEDAVWSFLADEQGPGPLAALLPGQTVLVDSLSKRAAPGLTAGFLVAPEPLRPALADALRAGAAFPGAFALEAAVRWIGDGTVARIVGDKRADAAARQRLAAEVLADHTVRADQGSYYLWWELPEPWRAETFTAAALEHGIAVTPGAAFAADPRTTPRAVRVALASPPLDVLERALRTLVRLAAG